MARKPTRQDDYDAAEEQARAQIEQASAEREQEDAQREAAADKAAPPVVLGAQEPPVDPAKRGDVVTMTANQTNEPRRTPEAPQPVLTPEAAFPGEACVTMVSPRAFFVLLNDRRRVGFKKGPQQVPASLQEHKYVKDNGVKPYAG